MQKKILSLVLVSACIFLFAGSCDVEVSTANLSDAKMCSETTELQCAEDTNVFSTTTPVIYCTAVLNNAPEGTLVTASWTYLGDGESTFIDSATVESEEITSDLEFSLTKPDNDWPAGDYEVELRIHTENAQPVTKKFSIE